MKLAFTPQQPNYNAQLPGARSAILQGPSSRFAKDYERKSIVITLQWKTNGLGFQYLRSFYKLNRVSVFTVDLILETSTLTEYTARFVSGFKLASVTGDTWVVQMNVEVKLQL